MGLYYQAIPFIFYGWAAVIIVPFAALRIIPPLFAMKRAYARAEGSGQVYSEKSARFNEQGSADLSEGRLVNFVLPIGLLITVTIVTEDLLLGLVYSLILQLVLYLVTRTINFNTFTERFAKGFADMIPMLFICAGALTVKQAMDAIGLPAYVINAVLPYMTPALFPAITFVVVAGLSFITGSNWGIPAVTVPIIAPLAVLSGANVPMTLAAIVSGGTFGSHACFYSDATVLTSQASGIDNMEHAITQIPYAVIGAVLAIAAYIGFGLALT
jgi:Na+/H+ antiporter NhaC